MTRPTRTTKKATTAPVAPVADQAPDQATTDVVQTPDQAAPVAPKAPVVVGTLTLDAADLPALNKAYADATPGIKAKIRNAITAGMGAAVQKADIGLAQIYMAAQAGLVSATPAKADTDYTAELANRIMALRLAAYRLATGQATPEGMDADKIDMDRLATLIDGSEDMGEYPATIAEAVSTQATRLATTKITKSVDRGSIEDHIAAAFATVPVGTRLTVAQIRTKSGAASDGAIAARLWPIDAKTKAPRATTLDLAAMGLELTDRDGVRAVRKIRDIAPTTPAINA